MPFSEPAVALFKAITVIVVEPVQNATVASAPTPGELLADSIEFADNRRAAARQRENDGDSPEPPEEIGARTGVLSPQPRKAEDDNEHGQPPGEVLQPGQEGSFDLVLQERHESARTADQIVKELGHACRTRGHGRRRWAWRLSEGGQAQATGNRNDAQGRYC